ncbi:MAG: hypothetical protein MZW92_12360 [Comamonadaceae bacterium]|nr:hypothetical protein [Comamonadaceae bacterium]
MGIAADAVPRKDDHAHLVETRLLCLTLLAVLIASIIVPVLIVLGLSERWLLFFPYALFVGALIVMIAQSDRSNRPAPAERPTIQAFLSVHLLIVAGGTIHAFLLAFDWLGARGDSGWWPELAAVVFLAVTLAKWQLSRIPFVPRPAAVVRGRRRRDCARDPVRQHHQGDDSLKVSRPISNPSASSERLSRFWFWLPSNGSDCRASVLSLRIRRSDSKD